VEFSGADIKQMGFIERKLRSTWAPDEEQKLEDFLHAVANGKALFINKDPFVHISRHVLDGSKNEDEVRSFILHLFKIQNQKKKKKQKKPK
jgi:hypothetical protein